MSVAQWTVVLMATGGGLTWATFIARLLWLFRGKWDDTNATLAGLKDKIAELAARDAAMERKLDQHLTWHGRRNLDR